MDLNRKTDFVVQQGFSKPDAQSCPMIYAGLQFQPRIIAIVFLFGTVMMSPAVFAVLAAVLLWSAAVPRWNPFDLVQNAIRRGGSTLRLSPAPPPRRFAQTLAGLMSAAIAVLLALELRVAALVIAGMLGLAIAALVFGGFCFGSWVFHLVTRRNRVTATDDDVLSH